jgi:hypothetical protein
MMKLVWNSLSFDTTMHRHLIGDKGRTRVPLHESYERTLEAPLVGTVWLQGEWAEVKYEKTDDEEGNDKILEREFERIVRHAISIGKYSSNPGIESESRPHSLFVRVGPYDVEIIKMQYSFGWEVAPDQAAWDAGKERERIERERDRREKEEKEEAKRARRRERDAERRMAKKAREEAK